MSKTDNRPNLRFKGFTDAWQEKKLGEKWTSSSPEQTTKIVVDFDETMYNALVQRYKETHKIGLDVSSSENESSFDIDVSIIEIKTDRIDADYMNSRFEKYYRNLNNNVSKEDLDKSLDELHRTFSTLTQEEQKYANILLNDITRGELKNMSPNKTFRDYLTEYTSTGKKDQVEKFANLFGMDVFRLNAIMMDDVNDANINANGRLSELEATVVKEKAAEYFTKTTGKKVSPFGVNAMVDKLIRGFIQSGGFDIEK